MPDLEEHPDKGRLDGLVEARVLSGSEAAHALALLAHTQEPLDRVLTQAGIASETSIAAFYAERSGVPLADPEFLANLPPLPDDMLGQLNPDFLQSERIWPLGLDGAAVVAGVVDPDNLVAADALAFALSRTVKPVILTQAQFDACILAEPVSDEPSSVGENFDVFADAERLRDMAAAGPVVRHLDGIIAAATRMRASDIHIELQHREAKVRYRVDGLLHDQDSWPLSQAVAVISRVKVLAELDITERRRPQDGRFSVPVSGRAIDLRVSVVPGQYGESLVLRLLDPDASLHAVEELGFSDQTMAVARRALSLPHGLILVTGPTGSGKTTTLYAFLRQLATAERKILTIEDPIEYRLRGIAQSQTNPAIGVTFSSALRAFLRHDPDVMMVGEIRDAETAQTAVQAAMTGHLVLSTLHTNDAASAVTRLRDMGVEDYMVASTLVAAFGQRLVRRACPACKGAGCSHCQHSGFSGRVAVTEGFGVDDDVRAALRSAKPDNALSRLLAERRFATMWEDGLAKVEAGITSRAELMRALSEGRISDGSEIRHG